MAIGATKDREMKIFEIVILNIILSTKAERFISLKETTDLALHS